MSTFTETFKFAKPSGDDNVSVSPFNSNADSIDAILTAGGGYEFSQELEYYDIISTGVSTFVNYVPAWEVGSTVPVKVFVDGELDFEEECTVVEDNGMKGIYIMHESEEDPVLAFMLSLHYDVEGGQLYVSENESTLLTVDSNYIGSTIRFDLPCTITTVTPIPAKYLTEAPAEVFSGTERVVGTYLGKPLYEQTCFLGDSSAITNDIPFGIPNGYIEDGYIADAFTILYQDGTFAKSYPQFKGDSDYGFTCTLYPDKITVYRRFTEHFDDYDHKTVVKVRYTKSGDAPQPVPRAHTIRIPRDVTFTDSGRAYGNIDDAGALGLSVGSRYGISAQFNVFTYTSTPTATDYGNGVVAVEIAPSSTWELGYLRIYDNAYFDENTATVSYREGCYCFSWDISTSVTATADVIPIS